MLCFIIIVDETAEHRIVGIHHMEFRSTMFRRRCLTRIHNRVFIDNVLRQERVTACGAFIPVYKNVLSAMSVFRMLRHILMPQALSGRYELDCMQFVINTLRISIAGIVKSNNGLFMIIGFDGIGITIKYPALHAICGYGSTLLTITIIILYCQRRNVICMAYPINSHNAACRIPIL